MSKQNTKATTTTKATDPTPQQQEAAKALVAGWKEGEAPTPQQLEAATLLVSRGVTAGGDERRAGHLLLPVMSAQITTDDATMRETRRQLVAVARQIGAKLEVAHRACGYAGVPWGEWLTASPFKYSTAYANNLRAVADPKHSALIDAALEKNPQMGTTEAIAVLRAAGVRKVDQKGGGKGQGRKARKVGHVQYRTIEQLARKRRLKAQLADLLALLGELRIKGPDGKTIKLVVDGIPDAAPKKKATKKAA